jgi:DNA-directed RNA polymerase specialized sigma24 family protein
VQSDLAKVERAITAVKAGDPSALHYLYVRYADVVCAYVASIVGAGDDAEEVTQAVFLKLPRAVAAYEAGGLPFEGWLLRVARGSALEFLRTRREMSPERLELLALRHLAGLSTSDISARLDPRALLA